MKGRLSIIAYALLGDGSKSNFANATSKSM